MSNLNQAIEKTNKLFKKNLQRAYSLKEDKPSKGPTSKTIIGVLSGDGIGPTITNSAHTVLKHMLKNEIAENKVEIKIIKGLTIENRLKEKSPIPAKVLKEVKDCDVILKGPTTTPNATDTGINLESANVALRKELDLYANVRPVKIKEESIDWTFFRENTEGGYALGSEGLNIDGELFVDFTVATKQGCRRIAKSAFEYARKNGKKRVSIITKANVIKTTDGIFLKECMDVSKDYSDICVDDWYVDITAAKLIDPKRRKDFEVFILPNLYGDILTDEAAQFQGGVGTAGSANIGDTYAMFEAIHGSAPRMVEEKRDIYCDPSSMLRASVMLLSHIGHKDKARMLETVLDEIKEDASFNITGRSDGIKTVEFTDRLIGKLMEQSR